MVLLVSVLRLNECGDIDCSFQYDDFFSQDCSQLTFNIYGLEGPGGCILSPCEFKATCDCFQQLLLLEFYASSQGNCYGDPIHTQHLQVQHTNTCQALRLCNDAFDYHALFGQHEWDECCKWKCNPWVKAELSRSYHHLMHLLYLFINMYSKKI